MTKKEMTADEALEKAADLENQAYTVRNRERSKSLLDKAQAYLETALSRDPAPA